MNFKVGQKVVCVTNIEGGHPSIIKPKKGEIVTILRFCAVHKDGLDLVEYEFAKDGKPQSFNRKHFRPIDYSFGKQITEEIEQEINEEQLVKL